MASNELTSKYYDICFYRADTSLIKCDQDRKVYSKGSDIPEGSDYFRASFDAQKIEGVKINRMTVDNSKNIIIRNNDIGHNRRQGITAGGEDVQILNNYIHHTNGTSPQAGIDIEPGFYPAINHLIKGNEFYNNKIQIVLAYGEAAKIEDNIFKQENLSGSVGVYIHAGFNKADVNNNTFIGSGLTMKHEYAAAKGNTFSNGKVNLLGTNITFTNAVLTDTSLSVGEKEGAHVNNVTIINTKKNENKGTVAIWDTPLLIENLTIKGAPIDGLFIGKGSKDAVIKNLIVEDLKGTSIPGGQYINCSFSLSHDVTIGLSMHYPETLFDECEFNDVTLLAYNENSNAMIKNSTFRYDGDLSAPAVYAIQAKDISVINNQFFAKNLTSDYHPIIKLGRYAWSNRKSQVFGGTIKGNEIHTANQEKGIDTAGAGMNAPSFNIEDNILYNAKLLVKDGDIQSNNKILEN